MSRKEYVRIAAILRWQMDHSGGSDATNVELRATIHSIALDIAVMCTEDNPQFDRGHFFTACGF